MRFYKVRNDSPKMKKTKFFHAKRPLYDTAKRQAWYRMGVAETGRLNSYHWL